MTNIETYIWVFTAMATATLAASAVMQAARHQYDIFGATVLAFVTALGGGTVRDLLLGVKIFWVNDYRYILMILFTVLVSVLALKFIPKGKGFRLQVLEYMDAMGLALFTVLGVQKALTNDAHIMIAVIMGIITGVVGGIGRDLLCNEQPTILKSDIYAILSMLGGIVYVFLINHVNQNQAMICVIALVFTLRIGVLIFRPTLPSIVKHNDK